MADNDYLKEQNFLAAESTSLMHDELDEDFEEGDYEDDPFDFYVDDYTDEDRADRLMVTL